MTIGAMIGLFAVSSGEALAAPTFDVNNAGVFQLDGNTCNDAASVPPWDWANQNCPGVSAKAPVGLFNSDFSQALTTGATGPAAFGPAQLRNSIICNDAQATPTCPFTSDLSFQTGGSKDGTNPSSGWQCAPVKPVTPKDEIDNAYAAVFNVPQSDGTTHQVLYMAIERAITNGTSNAGFWVTQNGLSCPAAGGSFSGNHANGDLLLFATFNSGGAICPTGATSTACVDAFEWSGGATGSLVQTPVLGGSACTQGTTDICGMVNTDNVQTPWAPHNTAAAAIPANGFFEVGVDLTDFYKKLSLPVPCLSTFLADTRASGTQGNAVSSVLHDYISGSFPTCFPKTTLTKTITAVNHQTPVSVNGTVTVHTNDVVTYTYTDSNTGLDSLSNVSVVDNMGTPATAKCSPVNPVTGPDGIHNQGDVNNNGLLDPGETWTFTCSTSYSTPGPEMNVAVGHGFDPTLNQDDTWCMNPASPPAGVRCDQTERASTTLNVIAPHTILTKTVTAVNLKPPVTPPGAQFPTIHNGDIVTYTYTESNPASTNAPLSSVSVSDTLCSPVTFVSGDTNSNGILDPGETWTFTCMTAVTAPKPMVGQPAPTVTNTATATGTDPLGTVVTFCAPGTQPAGTICDANEQATATVSVIHSDTILTKSVSLVNGQPPTSVNGVVTVHQGDTVTYQFVEKNNGDSAIANVAISDPICSSAPTLVSGDTNHNGILDVGETWTFTCTATLAQGQSGTTPATVTNTATGTGTDVLGATVTFCGNTPPANAICSTTEQSSVTVNVIHPNTALSKQVSAVVTYSFAEKNTGDVPLTNPMVTDSNTAPGTNCTVAPVLGTDGIHNIGDVNNNGIFDPGETWQFTCTTSFGPTTNYTNTDTGVGSAIDPLGSTVTFCNTPTSSTICSPTETDTRTIKVS
jgi:uncharacterized repeat protein (TIGR01451 family)